MASFLRDPGNLILPESASDRERNLPQTYLEKVARSLAFDETGMLTDIMEAARVEDYQQADESLMESPRFYSHNGDDRTWSASADRGHYRYSTATLTLSDNVVLTNDASGGRLKTEEMTILMQEKIASADVPVTITQGLSSTRADGMHADLELERITMQPNVESIYVPAD